MVQNLVGSREPLDFQSLLAQMFMLQTWIPGFGLTWNYPAWTLSAEWAAYLMMGLLVLFAPADRVRTIGALVIIAVAAGVFYRELLASEQHNVISVFRCLTGFFTGFVLHGVWKARPLRSKQAAQILEPVLIAGLVAVLYSAFDDGWYFVNHAFFALFIWVFASDLGFVSKAVSRPWLLWLGKISFSFYMVHAIVLIYMIVVAGVLQRVTGVSLFQSPIDFDGHPVSLIDLGAPWVNNLLALAYFGVVTVAAALVYKYVEDPSRVAFSNLAKTYLAKQAKPAAPVGELQSGDVAPTASVSLRKEG
jgi:peptidoglycan/LPS O-acetylase OafA/YrhL